MSEQLEAVAGVLWKYENGLDTAEKVEAEYHQAWREDLTKGEMTVEQVLAAVVARYAENNPAVVREFYQAADVPVPDAYKQVTQDDEPYLSEVRELQKMADRLEFTDKTCACDGCQLTDMIIVKLRGLAGWIERARKELEAGGDSFLGEPCKHTEFDECRCPCHQDSMMEHVGPCCVGCQSCGRMVRT